jgi:uncharacterized integral membrane protein
LALCSPGGLLIDDEETPMRWICLAVIIPITAAAIIFALQNFEIVTMSFLGFNVRVPLAPLVQLMSVAGARADLVRAWRDVSFLSQRRCPAFTNDPRWAV